MSYVLDTSFGCHLSANKLDANGYAYHGKTRAHIAAWEAANGPRPMHDGEPMELDHLCRVKRCCNPLHLEPVTPRENGLRKSWSYRCARKLCAKGHSMEGALVTSEMGRLCRQCHVEQKAAGLAQGER